MQLDAYVLQVELEEVVTVSHLHLARDFHLELELVYINRPYTLNITYWNLLCR